jgi:hypothetical protein
MCRCDSLHDSRQWPLNSLVKEANWNYGNAIQDGNFVLGRIAVHEYRITDAKEFLKQAGDTPGSPQLDSFGPNMSLAKDMLEAARKTLYSRISKLVGSFGKTISAS